MTLQEQAVGMLRDDAIHFLHSQSFKALWGSSDFTYAAASLVADNIMRPGAPATLEQISWLKNFMQTFSCLVVAAMEAEAK